MLKFRLAFIAAALATALPCGRAQAQHLWWDLEGQKDATCLYGEITVLATNPGIYYCGANWHPGEPAGGYCGIQHNGPNEKRTIFSIWDTTDALHPRVIEADAKTQFNRFGGEGTGAHTHMLWPWETGETFRFFARKYPGAKPDTTDTRYWLFDPKEKKWLASATISNPNGGKPSVATFGGGMNSFLENFTGKERDVPKLALYRLWLGPSVDKMKCLTRAGGDGTWGKLHDAYFLAAGSDDKLKELFDKSKEKYGLPIYGAKDAKHKPISNKPLPKELIKTLQELPHADAVKEK